MERLACIGLAPADVTAVKNKYEGHVLVYEVPPKMYSHLGQLYAESATTSGKWLPIDLVAWYGYFPQEEHTADVRKAIALSDAPSFPDVRRTVLHDDRALSLIQAELADPAEPLHRGYMTRGSRVILKEMSVWKVGNDHCGDGKLLVDGFAPQADRSGVLEPFVKGESIRALIVGRKFWMLKYESADWRKNVNAKVTEVHPAEYPGIQPRAWTICDKLGLWAIGIDFIGSNANGWKLLEVNAYPGLDDVVEAQETFRELLVGFATDRHSPTR
jgi:hypothetical protein